METHDSATFDILSVIFKQPTTLLLLLLNHTTTARYAGGGVFNSRFQDYFCGSCQSCIESTGILTKNTDYRGRLFVLKTCPICLCFFQLYDTNT